MFLLLNAFRGYYSNNDFFNNFANVLEYVPTINDKIENQSINDNDEIIKCVKSFIEKNISDCQVNTNKVIISLSGGVDSMVLATILKHLGYFVIGAHINYNNRKETADEQKFLEQWCYNNDIYLYTKVITSIKRGVTKRTDYEIESKNIRFDFYKEVMSKENSNYIMLAHHKDDIVENIFANVCRGRYILNLAVIKEKSIINDVMIMRPLIELYKSSIYEFSEKYQVPYFKDTTPEWSVRGKYRNNIYPMLEDTFSKNVKENLIGLSKQSYDWNELVSNVIIDPFMEKITYHSSYCIFNVEDYNLHPLCFWNVVLMNVFYKYGKNCPSRKGIQTFMNNIQTKNVCFISLSNSCVCRNKNYEITIEFKLQI